MRVVLLRHAEVQEEYIGKYNGHNDIGLSKKGTEEAKKLARRFEHEGFDATYCSDLRRARETLAPFSQAENAYYSEKLREKSWGVHEGLSFEEITAQGIIYEDFAQWIEALDGESVAAYMQRVEEFFFNELFSKEYDNALVITHAGVIRVLMALVQNVSLEKTFAVRLPYGSYTVYDTDLQTFSTIKT